MDVFEVHSALASQFGFSKRRRLKPGVVPTISRYSKAASERGAEPSSWKRRLKDANDPSSKREELWRSEKDMRYIYAFMQYTVFPRSDAHLRIVAPFK